MEDKELKEKFKDWSSGELGQVIVDLQKDGLKTEKEQDQQYLFLQEMTRRSTGR